MRIEDSCGEITCTFTRGTEPFGVSLVSDSGNEYWLTCCYDPLHPDNIIVDDGALKNLSGHSMWQISPISPNRLTT
jgi:hypothetical protein